MRPKTEVLESGGIPRNLCGSSKSCGSISGPVWKIVGSVSGRLQENLKDLAELKVLSLATVHLPPVYTHLPPAAYPSMPRSSFKRAAVQRVASTSVNAVGLGFSQHTCGGVRD